MTLKEITREILHEGVSNNDINNAINNHKYVVINYKGTDGTHMGNRMIEPVAFGCTTAGNPVIRAFERFGDTKTGVPKWKYLRVDRITNWRETDKTFDEPHELFNPDDDKTMSVVYNIAKFGNEEDNTMPPPPTSSPKKKEDEKPEVYRTETERGLEKLRKQLNNPLTLADFLNNQQKETSTPTEPDKKTQDGFVGTDNKTQPTGPKTNKDAKKGTDDVYNNGYNYNTFDNSLSASGRNAKRTGHYYYQNRNKGKFAKGSILDNPPVDDTEETEEYLNTDHGNNGDNTSNVDKKKLDYLRRRLGDTSKPMTLRDLRKKMGKR